MQIGQAQDAYYWRDQQKCYLEPYLKQWFILAENQTDTSLIANQLQKEGIRYRPFEKLSVGISDFESKNYWTVVFMDDSTGLPVADFQYAAPFFTTDNQGIVGLSHLFYVTLQTLDDTVLLKGMAAQNRLEILGSNPFRPLWFTLACSRLSAGNALEMSNVFYESGLFAYAEPDIMVSNMVCSSSNTTPCVNDTLFPAQWNLLNTGQNDGVAGVDIGYCMARQLTEGSQDIIVAVIDQGVDLTHPDLNNIYSFSYDAMSGSSPSVIYHAHGTECAGIIGASADNRTGIAGIASGCPIMSISNTLSVSPDNAQK